MIGVYKITNKIDGKFYIGSSNNIKQRWSLHLSRLNRNKHGNNHFQNAWNKYGKENFIFEIIEECSIDDLNIREQYWIETLYCCDKTIGYNHIGSVNNIRVFDEETKLKMSINHANLKGINHPLFGKHHSIESRDKISTTRKEKFKNGELIPPMKGKKFSPELREKLSLIKKNNPNHFWLKGEKSVNFGRKHTEEWKINHSKNYSGENHPGRKLNWEIVNKIREEYNPELNSTRQLAREYGISQSTIHNIVSFKSWKINLKESEMESDIKEPEVSASPDETNL